MDCKYSEFMKKLEKMHAYTDITEDAFSIMHTYDGLIDLWCLKHEIHFTAKIKQISGDAILCKECIAFNQEIAFYKARTRINKYYILACKTVDKAIKIVNIENEYMHNTSIKKLQQLKQKLKNINRGANTLTAQDIHQISGCVQLAVSYLGSIESVADNIHYKEHMRKIKLHEITTQLELVILKEFMALTLENRILHVIDIINNESVYKIIEKYLKEEQLEIARNDMYSFLKANDDLTDREKCIYNTIASTISIQCAA